MPAEPETRLQFFGRKLFRASLALAFVLLFWIFTGGHTDLVCRFDGECARHGRCVGSRWFACVAASDSDCRASDDCRSMGKCTEMLSDCTLMMSADCALTTGCKTEGRCFLPVGAGAACTTAHDALAPLAAFIVDDVASPRSALHGLVERAGQGGHGVAEGAPTPVAAAWGAVVQQAPEGGPPTVPYAAVVRFTLPLESRTDHGRRDACFVGIFEGAGSRRQWHEAQVWTCDEAGLTASLKAWRTGHRFAPMGSWQEQGAPAVFDD